MHWILDSLQPVLTESRLVTIDQAAVVRFADGLELSHFEDSEIIFVPEGLSTEQYYGFVFVLTALLFCFWGKPKWTLSNEGKSYGGSQSLQLALTTAIRAGSPLTDPRYLATVSRDDVAAILARPVKIPLLDERVGLLHDLGSILINTYGTWTILVEKGGFQAAPLARFLAETFPSVYADVATYRGHSVGFYKKAQIFPVYVNDLAKKGFLPRKVEGMAELTVGADYKLPQILRQLGILQYAPSLATDVDNLNELAAGSEAEVEIRAATVWATELIRQAASKRLPDLTAGEVGCMLWLLSQDKPKLTHPHHLTRSAWY